MNAAVDPILRAVLFDMDGTLTDSERLWTLSLERVAESYGGVLSAQAREAMVGHDMWATIGMLHDDLGLAVDPRATARRLVDETERIFRRGLPWQPGAERLLSAVRRAGLATALVTATQRHLVDIALQTTLGVDTFDVTVCGDEVGANKPDPEPYRRALVLLGVGAENALAIEDSPAGSRSAREAGLVVVVVPSEVPVPPADGLVLHRSLTEVTVDVLRAIHGSVRLTTTASV